MNEVGNYVINLYSQMAEGDNMPISEEFVNKALNIVIYIHPNNEDEVFLKLCALNLLNAAIKTDSFKDYLSYDLIMSNAAKMIAVIDNLNKKGITYYYDKDESRLYFRLAGIVFGFHHAPLTGEILKASFANPIIWPGIRLQKIAQPLLDYAVNLLKDDIEIPKYIETYRLADREKLSDNNNVVATPDDRNKSTTPNVHIPSGFSNDAQINQESFDIINGIHIGDDVEINSYGVLKSGRISVLNKQFVQLELSDNKSVRIRFDAISSIESQFSSDNIVPIDITFASAAFKEILIAANLYSSSPIETNSTITMVENRRIWLTTDTGQMASCSKNNVIGLSKEKLVKGQRIYVPSFKKDKVYWAIMEMSFYELYDFFEKLTLQKKDNTIDLLRSQIFSLLTFIAITINDAETRVRIKSLKRQIKSVMSLSPLSSDDISEDDMSYIENSDNVSFQGTNNSEVTSIDSSEDTPSEAQTVHSEESNPEESSIDIYKPEITPIQRPKIVGKIDLVEIATPKKKKEGEVNDSVTTEYNDSISIDYTNDLLPSMGKIIKLGPSYGFIEPHNLDNNLYFKTGELVSYVGIIDSPSIGDDVVYSIEQNNQGQPIAVCVHKQCSRDVVEDLVEKFRYNPKICMCLKKHIENFDNNNSETNDDIEGLVYFLNKVGVDPKTSFSPNDVEKLFADNLSSDKYAIAVEYLIDEVIKKDPAKCYNLFLRSSSYARSHKMYDVSKHLIEKALKVFKGEPGKTKYFKGLLKTIDALSSRIEINENTLAKNLEISGHTFSSMPTYVRDIILTNKDFNGITLDKDTIRTGLYKEEYIEELNDNIKQNSADDLLYLTMMKLQLSFHPKEYNPKDDITKFLVNRAKNILAIGDEKKYSDVRYLLRLAYRIKTIETGFDNTVGLYLMTLGDYTASEIDMYMNKGDRSDYRFEDLLKNILVNEVDNSLELALLAESNVDIKNRIVREYEKIGKDDDSFDEFPTVVNEVKKRYIQYSENPTINFMSFISYLQTTAILLDNEMNVVKNDFVKIVSDLTDFNTGQKYNAIRDAYNNIIQKIDAILPNLIDHPTEIGYETILPALRLLKKNVRDKFKELEQRANPTIQVEIIDSVGMEDSNSVELKVEIRNSGDSSARSIHINSLKVFGDDLAEENSINIDVPLPAGEDKLINVELPLSNNAVEEKIAEVEFLIEYDDIYIATEQRIPSSSRIDKTIPLEIKPFVEINNRFRQCSGGEELESGDTMFYGRNGIIRNIKEAILAGTKNQIAIYGQKRSGKSSLLNQIKGRLESDESHSVICGKFSLQGLPDNELNPVRWILESIAKSLLEGIRKCGIKKLEAVLTSLSIDMTKISKDKIYESIISKFFSEESDAFKSLGSFIEYINTIDILQNSHFVIFIDEFTYLYQLIKDKEKRVNEDFMRRWIALIETPGINLQAIVAAQDTFPHFMNESYASNCFNKFSKEPLSYLNKEEALQLIKNPIKDVIFHNHSDELIYDYTLGSAFFTQIFCTRLVDYLNAEKSNVVGKEEVEKVAERLCTGTHRLEKSTFECLTKEADGSVFNQKDNEKVLKAIAENTRAGGYVNIKDLDVGFSQEKLKSVLGNLYDRRVISKQDENYSIYVKLFVKWILNN